MSGLIIVSDTQGIGAYDVDTDMWHDVGRIPLSRTTPCCTGIDLLGYSAELDRLVLTTYVGREEATLLLDPRTGDMSIHTIPTPVVNLAWPGHSYGLGDTVYVASWAPTSGGQFAETDLCGFDATTSSWTSCFTGPTDRRYAGFGAIVGDPINDRLLLINGRYGDWWAESTDHVWAIDLQAGDLTEILAVSE